MYHIKLDKRSETSADMLYEALIGCLREKPFEEISITEISRRATTSRSTFYRNFDEIMDILFWKCDLQFAKVLHAYVNVGSREHLGLLEYVLGFWQDHSQVLELLLAVNRIDIIFECFEKNSVIVMEALGDQISLPKEQEAYFMPIRISVFVGVIQTWLKCGKKESAHQLSAMLAQQLYDAAANRLIF